MQIFLHFDIGEFFKRQKLSQKIKEEYLLYVWQMGPNTIAHHHRRTNTPHNTTNGVH